MTELDELFPEAAERQRKAKEDFKAHGERLQRTNFGRYPDCQEVCDAFLNEMDWQADPYTIKQVAAGARDFVSVHGNKPELIKRTIRRLKKEAPHIYENIASPRSLITLARKQKEPDRRRYLKGVDDE